MVIRDPRSGPSCQEHIGVSMTFRFLPASCGLWWANRFRVKSHLCCRCFLAAFDIQIIVLDEFSQRSQSINPLELGGVPAHASLPLKAFPPKYITASAKDFQSYCLPLTNNLGHAA